MSGLCELKCGTGAGFPLGSPHLSPFPHSATARVCQTVFWRVRLCSGKLLSSVSDRNILSYTNTANTHILTCSGCHNCINVLAQTVIHDSLKFLGVIFLVVTQMSCIDGLPLMEWRSKPGSLWKPRSAALSRGSSMHTITQKHLCDHRGLEAMFGVERFTLPPPVKTLQVSSRGHFHSKHHCNRFRVPAPSYTLLFLKACSFLSRHTYGFPTALTFFNVPFFSP